MLVDQPHRERKTISYSTPLTMCSEKDIISWPHNEWATSFKMMLEYLGISDTPAPPSSKRVDQKNSNMPCGSHCNEEGQKASGLQA